MEKKVVGKISHYYAKIGVAVVDLSGELATGDAVSIEGPGTSVNQKVDSMQIEKKAVQAARQGQSVGLKVSDRVRKGDTVFKVMA